MKEFNIRATPKHILKLIEDKDKNEIQNGHTRFYAYLTKRFNGLTKVTVAVKNKGEKKYYKQVAVHFINKDICYVKDMEYTSIFGLVVGWHVQGLSRSLKWYETDKWEQAKDKYYDPKASILNKEFLLKFDEFKFSAGNQYAYNDLFTYLRLYNKYPQCEYLIKLGLHRLATSKTILEKLGKDKGFQKFIINNRQEIFNGYYYIPTIIGAYKQNIKLNTMQTILQTKKELQTNYKNTIIRKLFKDKELKIVIDYIAQQSTSLSSYNDYLNACEKLKLDLTLAKNLMPKDFIKWHDIRIDQLASKKAKEDAKKRKALYKQFGIVAEKYLSLQKDNSREFVCVIAKSPAELITEGEKLHHCVGKMNYDQKFIKEQSLIFFVREKISPNNPFVTLEYNLENKKVQQCYTDNNAKPSETVLNYINKIWLPYANRKLQNIIKNATTKAVA